MEGNWDVYLENKVVGTCSIEQRGLYFRIVCRCSKAATGICRLAVQWGNQTLDLGVMIPEGGFLCLNRSIPVKKFPKGQPRFFIKSDEPVDTDNFVAVREGEGFLHLSRLGKARLARRNGEMGVILNEDH